MLFVRKFLRTLNSFVLALSASFFLSSIGFAQDEVMVAQFGVLKSSAPVEFDLQYLRNIYSARSGSQYFGKKGGELKIRTTSSSNFFKPLSGVIFKADFPLMGALAFVDDHGNPQIFIKPNARAGIFEIFSPQLLIAFFGGGTSDGV